jgi:putative hydrolase of the HAD superfamily
VIRSVMFDFGGVITSSPFDAFDRYEREQGLPAGFIRSVNSTNPDTNAWANLERGTLDVDGFADAFETEARGRGHELDGHAVLTLLGGDVRPAMVEAVRRCAERFETACVTNNFGMDIATRPEVAAVYALFDVVLESRTLGVRKPEPRFYELACVPSACSPMRWSTSTIWASTSSRPGPWACTPSRWRIPSRPWPSCPWPPGWT